MEKASLSLAHRAVDVMFFGVMGWLFWQGYSSASNGWFSTNQTQALLALFIPISFVAILYPFRVHTRLLWGTMMPVSLFVVRILGAQVYTRLNIAPGMEPELSLAEIAVHLILYVAFVLLWVIPAVVGFELKLPNQDGQQRRTSSLGELFIVTGLFCVSLILVRETITFGGQPTMFRELSWPFLVRIVVVTFVIYGLSLWAGFYCRWPLAIVLPVVALLVGCLCEGAGLSLQYRAVFGRSDVPQILYWQIIQSHLTEFAALAGMIMVGRMAGFRLVKSTSGAEQPVAPNASQTQPDVDDGIGENIV